MPASMAWSSAWRMRRPRTSPRARAQTSTTASEVKAAKDSHRELAAGLRDGIGAIAAVDQVPHAADEAGGGTEVHHVRRGDVEVEDLLDDAHGGLDRGHGEDLVEGGQQQPAGEGHQREEER